MREDWDERARLDAEGFIYTRDSENDIADFGRSGLANYNQLVRPYLPVLLRGRPASQCDVVEIGCGTGRMTEWFARDFRKVAALDVSPAMIEAARQRLGHLSNIRFHAGSGADLAPVADESADLVFSYIVFQHVPSRAVIENYVREAARVLRTGGMFKFQVNGDQSPEYLAHTRDTWLGETFSVEDIARMLAEAGLSIISMEGAGTQYLVTTASKGMVALPETALLEGFGDLVDGSWRPIENQARVQVDGDGKTLYLGLYFWPESCHHEVTMAGHRFAVDSAGDHYFEGEGRAGEVIITIAPAPTRPPAFRIMGIY
jgi:SAM-dependent methyltransferase